MSGDVILGPDIGANGAEVGNRAGGGSRPVIPGDSGFGPTVVGGVEGWPIRRAVGHEQPQRGVLHSSCHPGHGKADIAFFAGAVHVEPAEGAIICVRATLSNERVGDSRQDEAV